MSIRTENRLLTVLGIVVAASTIGVQLISLGELKGQVTAIQEMLKSEVVAIKLDIEKMKDGIQDSDVSSSNKLADLNARVTTIEKKL